MLVSLLVFILIAGVSFAILLSKKNPKLSLVFATVVPFATFYLIGKLGYTTVFIVFAFLYIVIVNLILFKQYIHHN